MVEIQKRKVRKNGYACPYHPTQIFTFVLFFSDILSYFFIDLVSLAHNQVLVIVLGAIYIILALGTAYYCIIATKTDPSDPTISLE